MNAAEGPLQLFVRSHSFLYGSYPNPHGKESKELCDVLVVCSPDIITVSVKDIRASESGNLSVDCRAGENVRSKTRASKSTVPNIG